MFFNCHVGSAAIGIILAALALLAQPLHPANAEPAVWGLNAKFTGFGGAINGEGVGDRGVGGIAASITAPLMINLGLQVDGAFAQVGDDAFFDTGAHLFWRDPTIGMLGIYGGYAHIDSFGGQSQGRLGGEAQRYVGNITLDGAAGWHFGELSDRAYGRAKIEFYPLEELMFSGGYTYEGRSFGTVGFEYQVASGAGAGVSLFADSQFSDGQNYSVLGGLRVFLGPKDSLISRHRRQDPDNYVQPDLTAAMQAAADAKPQQSYAPPPVPAPNVPPPPKAPVPPPKPPVACSFVPDSNLCTRALQCGGAGYTVASPGPAVCGCTAAFPAPC